MKSKFFIRLIAITLACASAFSFVGCQSCKGSVEEGGNVPIVENPPKDKDDEPIVGGDPVDHEHRFTNYVSNNDGTKTAKCDLCNETDTIADDGTRFPTHEHSYSNYISNNNATCLVNATQTSKCDTCDKTNTIEIANSAKGHSFTKYVFNDNATAEKDGTKTAKCDRCDVTDTITAEGNKIPKPSIENNPVSGSVVIKKAVGDLEAAYVTWEIDPDAKWYNVYVKAAGASYTKLDAPLVRKYSTYFRADAVGLKKGLYDLKVVPVNADGTEAVAYASEAKNIFVEPHQRFGYAFVNGTSSGAYNEDGTLKVGAKVIYITQKTKDSVSLNVTGATTNPCVGLQAILVGYAKGKDSTPLSIRLVGNITDLSNMLGGDIVIENKNNAKGGITFEGIGSDATVNGWGLRLKNASNVEVRNLGFMNCDSSEGDDIGLQQGNDHIWVHNCDLFYGQAGGDADQAKGDGALDTKNSSYVTHSYNHFYDTGKSNLQGMKDETTENKVTYHHNWYDHSDSRHPRIRTCTVHIFNNYYDGVAKYGIGATMGCSVFVENNYFRSTAILRPMMSSMQGTDILDGEGTFSSEDGGIIKAFGNKYDASNLRLREYSATNTVEFDCYTAKTRDERVPADVKTKKGGTGYSNFDTADDMYKYTVESPDEAKTRVQKYAGRIDGGDFKFTFDNAKDDADYSVNSALKSALLGYKTDLIEAGEDESLSSGGGSGEGGGTVEPTPTEPIVGQITCSFEGGKSSNAAITVKGNVKNTSFTIHGLNKTFGSGLKMESATSVKFEIAEKMTLTLYIDGSGAKIKVDGKDLTSKADGNGDNVVTVTLEVGEHTITKKDSINLYYLVLSPVE